jgi:cyclic beta-1,2-glucan synthetase
VWRVEGTRYRFVVSNPEHLSHGVARAQLDGIDVDPTAIPLASDGADHEVTILIGSPTKRLRAAAAGSRDAES